jgi:uncharacterized BrkB/YihY/UPF0761 family membrane protein
VILLLCFYMSAYVTLVGAELNAEKEREAGTAGANAYEALRQERAVTGVGMR